MRKATRQHNDTTTDFETKARELISMTFALCEREMLSQKNTPTPKNKSIAAAALNLESAIKTFITLAGMRDE